MTDSLQDLGVSVIVWSQRQNAFFLFFFQILNPPWSSGLVLIVPAARALASCGLFLQRNVILHWAVSPPISHKDCLRQAGSAIRSLPKHVVSMKMAVTSTFLALSSGVTFLTLTLKCRYHIEFYCEHCVVKKWTAGPLKPFGCYHTWEKEKTLLTASLFIKQPRLGSDINYFLPKPIKLLMCRVLSPGPIMEINQKNHLSYSKPGSYLVSLSEGHRLP